MDGQSASLTAGKQARLPGSAGADRRYKKRECKNASCAFYTPLTLTPAARASPLRSRESRKAKTRRQHGQNRIGSAGIPTGIFKGLLKTPRFLTAPYFLFSGPPRKHPGRPLRAFFRQDGISPENQSGKQPRAAAPQAGSRITSARQLRQPLPAAS